MPRKKRPPLYEPKYSWDDRFHVLDYHGNRVVFFERVGLAKALNRTVDAIRDMERKGIIPKPKLRLPSFPHAYLYTEGQILAMIALAEEEGVINPAYHRQFSNRFIAIAHDIILKGN